MQRNSMSVVNQSIYCLLFIDNWVSIKEVTWLGFFSHSQKSILFFTFPPFFAEGHLLPLRLHASFPQTKENLKRKTNIHFYHGFHNTALSLSEHKKKKGLYKVHYFIIFLLKAKVRTEAYQREFSKVK